jgi:MFS family permease
MKIYNQATRAVATTLGTLVGLAGIDHGIFEILQGHIQPDSLMIAAIGPDQRFWIYGEETALTIIPSFLVSGILSVILGLIVTIWAIGYIDRKYGAVVLMLLSIALFLVGGGFAPIFMALIASLAASRIHKPLKFWRVVLPVPLRKLLGGIWQWVLIAFVVIFVFSVIVAIFGWPLTIYFDDETAFKHLNTLSFIMVGMMLLAVLSGFAYDIQQQIPSENQ